MYSNRGKSIRRENVVFPFVEFRGRRDLLSSTATSSVTRVACRL